MNYPIQNYLAPFLAILATITASRYLEGPVTSGKGSSIIMVLLFSFFLSCWNHFPRHKKYTFYLFNAVFVILFSVSIAVGQKLDLDIPFDAEKILKLTTGFFMAFFPVMCIASNFLDNYQASSLDNRNLSKKAYRLGFIFVVICWTLGYLASFPGIYAVDAMTWYLEFSTPSIPVSSQWSPIYAGLFYLFVHTGKVLFGNYECGLAIFIGIQSLLILWVIKKILIFVQNSLGNIACIIASLFFALVPTHAIMSMQTLQGAPFMACFAMMMIHLSRMVREGEEYWKCRKNRIAFILWGVGSCVLRNNAYYAFIAFIMFTLFYQRGLRLKLFLSIASILVITMIYKGPVLDMLGVSKGTALRESLSMPLQQMACVYTKFPEKLTQTQKEALESYITSDALNSYNAQPEISDVLKSNINIARVQHKFKGFVKLYMAIGLRAPYAYLQAAYMKNIGLLYVDKAYPDPRMWHPYLNYASYDLKNPQYIKIRRLSLFPQYNKLLGKLFGYSENGYGGDITTIFSSIPLFSILCRVSTYFWCSVYFTLYVLYKKQRDSLVYLGMVICFTLTILLGPVIMYRYYAPVVFAFPVIVAALFGNRGLDISQTKKENKVFYG